MVRSAEQLIAKEKDIEYKIIKECELCSQEPYIILSDGRKVYLDKVERETK